MLNNQQQFTPGDHYYSQNSCNWTGPYSIIDGCLNATTSPWTMLGMSVSSIGGALAFGQHGIFIGLGLELGSSCLAGALKAAVEYYLEF